MHRVGRTNPSSPAFPRCVEKVQPRIGPIEKKFAQIKFAVKHYNFTQKGPIEDYLNT